MRGTAVLLLATILAGLSAAELAARSYFSRRPNRLKSVDMILQSADPYFRLEGGEWISARSHGVRHHVPAKRAPGEKLVILVGESVAADFDVSTLANALRAHGYAAKPIAVNAGVGGYTTAAVRATARQAMQARPDLLVVMAGNNNAGYVPGPILSRLARHFQTAALYVSARESQPGDTAAFEADIRALVRDAVQKGATVVVCTLPVNYESPYGGFLPLHIGYFRDGWLAYHSGRYAEALERWSYMDPHPSIDFWRAQAERKLGRPDAALARLRDARIGQEGNTGRYTAERRDALLKIAADEGAIVADLGQAFEKANASPDAFIDDVHWRRPWDSLAAETIAAAVAPPAKKIPPLPRSLSRQEAETLADMALTMATHQETVSERVLDMFDRLWREAPEVLRNRLADPRAGSGRSWGSAGAATMAGPIEEKRWPLALATAGEALWRRGRHAEGDALLAQAAKDAELGELAQKLLALHADLKPATSARRD